MPKRSASVEPPDPTGKLPGYNRYIRRLYRQQWFPGVDENGAIFVSTKLGAVGRDAKKNREYLEGNALKKHLEEKFPQGFIHHVTNPEGRALSHKEAGGQRDLHGNTLQSWTDVSKKKAASEFEIPAGTKIMIVWPEIFDRDILINHPEYRYEYKDKNGFKKVSVKTPCPYCKSNKFISYSDKSGLKEGDSRTIADYRGNIPIICPIAECSNPDCERKKKVGDSSDKICTRTFKLYQPQTFMSYPPEVISRYESYMYTKVAPGHGKEMFVTEDLCAELLTDDTVFLACHRHMVDSFERKRTRALKDYARFIDTQSKDSRSKADWPQFNIENHNKLFNPPGKDKLGDVFDKMFQLVHPYLLRDLYNRTPGLCIKWDGTYRYAKMTLQDPESGEDIKVLCILFGQYGHILSFAFSKDEKGPVFQRLHYFLKKRCDRLGKSQEPRFAVTDTCCENVSDVATHWVAHLWPNITRAPYKDLMHGQKKVFDETRGHSHDLHKSFTSDVRDTCMLWDVASQKHTYKLYQTEEKKTSWSHEVGIPVMMKTSKYRKKIFNYIPDKRQLADGVLQCYTNLVADDELKRNEAALKHEGYLSYILKPVTGVRRGTENEVKNMVYHIKRGCYSYPLPPEEMAKRIDPDDEHSDLVRFASTSQGESANKQVNRMVHDVSQQSAIRAHQRLLLRVTRYNLDKDKKLAKVLKIEEPRSLEWCLHQALLKQHPSAFNGLFGKMVFPPELPSNYFEPIGIDYGRYKEWERIDNYMVEIATGMHQEEPAPEPMEVEQPQPSPATEADSPLPLARSPAVESVQEEFSRLSTPSKEGTPARELFPQQNTQVPTAGAASPQQNTQVTNTGAASPPKTPQPQPQPNTPTSSSTKKDFYSSQANWNRDLGKKVQVSVFNTYLPESKKLSHKQLQHFWRAAAAVNATFDSDQYTPRELAEKVAHAWNNTHFKMFENETIPVGLGGKMRSEHAATLLKAKGHDIRKRPAMPVQVGPPSQTTYKRPSLTREGVARMSGMALVPFLRKVGAPSKIRTTAGRRQLLIDHFDKHPEVKDIQI